MKKKILKTTLMIMVFSGCAKILSFINRIFIARILNEQAISYYSLVSSVLIFLIALSNFGIPNALTQLISSKKESHSSISAAILISVVNNFLLCIVCILGIPLYARIALNQDVLIPVLYSCLPLLPMIMITGLLKGYFTGRQKMLLVSSAQITEEIFRLIFLMIFLPSCLNSAVLMATCALFSQVIGEIGSTLHLSLSLLFHSRKKVLHYLIPEFEKQAMIELLSLSVPMTAARMCGSLTAFLEPIVMLNSASSSMQETYIQIYSVLNSYLLPIVTLPGFFSIALSSWILPAFSEAYGKHQISKAKSIFLASTAFALATGVSSSLFFFFFNESVCQIFYHKTDMSSLLKMLCLPFSVYSLQPVFICMLHAAQKSTRAMINTFFGCLIRLLTLSVLCMHSNEYAAVIALVVSSFATTILHAEAVISLFIHKKQSFFRPQCKKNF